MKRHGSRFVDHVVLHFFIIVFVIIIVLLLSCYCCCWSSNINHFYFARIHVCSIFSSALEFNQDDVVAQGWLVTRVVVVDCHSDRRRMVVKLYHSLISFIAVAAL